MFKRFYVVVARDKVESYLQQAAGIAQVSTEATMQRDMGLLRGLIGHALGNLLKEEQFEGNMDQDISLIRRSELKAIAHKLGAEESQTRGKSVKELRILVESLTHTPSGAAAPIVSKHTNAKCKMAYANKRIRRNIPLQNIF